MSSPLNSTGEPPKFDWPLAYEAEAFLRRYIGAFLGQNAFASQLAERMAIETGTDFYEWVDHFTLEPHRAADLLALGFAPEDVPAPAGQEVYYHPKAMMPRVILTAGGEVGETPVKLAIRPESVVDFAAAHDLTSPILGRFGARLREVEVNVSGDFTFTAVERLGYRGFIIEQPTSDFAAKVVQARELWRARTRNFPKDSDGAAHAFEVQSDTFALVGRDISCELFFAEERVYWEKNNTAGRVQKRRQDSLGLGWGNHDHHTYRCSRPLFTELTKLLINFGFAKRERYYAGAEAGWGAQISEQPITGITVFADVDLQPDETQIDFSVIPLPQASKLGTVGLWCGLHGDSLLQAGMHHLEARFDFAALRTQLEQHGIKTMRPFSDFPFLKQAFTEGERWKVRADRLEKLRAAGLITAEQSASFLKDGAIGSHLENLERKGGFKGFNQKSVSVIIAATDPRVQQAAH
jgi:hypothetical protein